MITSIMLWNEPNNLSHWDFQMDSEWREFSTMLKGAAAPSRSWLRTSRWCWADRHRPNALEWFDHQMKKLEDFDVTLTFCFTPPSLGRRPCHTSPPVDPEEFARFSIEMVQRYVLGRLETRGQGLQTPTRHGPQPTASCSRLGGKESL